MKETNDELQWFPQLDDKDIKFTHTEIMAKFVASIDTNGYPHLSFITSNKAISPNIVKWGEFTKGMSKTNVLTNPKQGFLYMTAEMPFRFLQIKADLDYISNEGEDAVDFNQMSLFRYNTYMRIYKVYFNKVKSARKCRKISLWGIIKGILSNLNPFRYRGKTGTTEMRVGAVGKRLFSGLIFPKFISYIDNDGYPVIIPCFQARIVENKRIIIPFSQFSNDLHQIPAGAKVSMFAMDFETVTQMIKGTYLGVQKKMGIVDIEVVYNSMPPKVGEIYPNKAKMGKITEFPEIL
ncbi:hypothetical protein [Candidatus Harpocratesius sp.]